MMMMMMMSQAHLISKLREDLSSRNWRRSLNRYTHTLGQGGVKREKSHKFTYVRLQ